MSERTTIGGTVYEAIGSSSSNLLLKCNGTARIQWGGKLIDLIKNGKIASGDSQELIFIITDESEIKSDGIYLLTTQESNKLWISKDGNKYDLTNADLYISASKPQTLTVDQKKQALDNIGLNYNSLEELQSAKIQNGIAYVLNTKTLYTIKDGVVEEFEAKLKTVSVDNTSVEGDVISGKVKLILSILDDEYLILADQRITANYSIHVKDSAQIGSESADATQGYRLYIKGGTSYLDVDEINVRHGFDIKFYTETTFDEFIALLNTSSLKPLEWYLIKDYQNPWKLQAYNEEFNRPILIRALDKKSVYEKGYLFKDHRVVIKYDPSYQKTITHTQTDGTKGNVTTRGLITWMKDQFNNEANFDFLDYSSIDEKNPFCTVHDQYIIEEGDTTKYDKSIFPRNSYNNKLIVHNLKGLLLKESIIGGVTTYEFDYANSCTIDFQFDDSKDKTMIMYDNNIQCYGLILTSTCSEFYNNVLNEIVKLKISNKFCYNTLKSVYNRVDFTNNIVFDEILKPSEFSEIEITNEVQHTSCKSLINSAIKTKVTECVFGNIENSVFEGELFKATINNVITPEPSYQYKFNKITNSSIDEISQRVEFLNEIIDTTINKITNQVVIEGIIRNSNINSIEQSIIKGTLEKVNCNDMLLTTIEGDIVNCFIENLTNTTIKKSLQDSTFLNITQSFINEPITSSKFKDISDCTFNATIDDSVFKNINSSTFDVGNITNVVSFYDLSGIFNDSEFPLLYISEKRKEIYINNGNLQIICIPDVIFYRGMIIMHSGIEEIPKGWALCDGSEYEWNGIKSQTPDLRNRFIKATETLNASEVKATDNEDINDKGELVIKKEQLPKHKHEIDITKLPQYTTNEIEGNTSRYDPQSQYVNTDSGTLSVGVSVSVSVSVSVGESSDSDSDSSSDSDSITLSGTTLNYLGQGSNYESIAHKHKIDWGANNLVTEENDKTEEQKPIKPIPNYYSLIFIMKL